MKIAIVTDSSAGIPNDVAQELGIYITRMPLMIDEQEFIEDQDISRASFIEKMKNGALVKTAQPPLGHVMNLFDELLLTYDHIVYIPISSLLSGSYQTACALALDYDGKVTVVDAKFVSGPLKILAVWANVMGKRGLNPQQIKETIENEAYMYAALIPEDVTYLKRGGRIKPAAAAIANMVKIVPILSVANGEIDLLEKVRTQKKAIKRGVEIILEKHNPEEYDFMVLDGECNPEHYQRVVKEIEKQTGRRPIETKLYPIVMAHTGPGSIGICAIKKL
ncbi:MAG TPA: DegV family protein [Erysipelothrix sp.]